MPRRGRASDRLAQVLAAEVRGLTGRLAGRGAEGDVEAQAQAIVAALLVARSLADGTGEGATLAKAHSLLQAAGLGAWLAQGADELAALAGRLAGLEVEGEAEVEGFFEHLLAAHDPALRRRRGVFYTPRAVVTATVAGVDALLREELGLADGLAATETWGELGGELPAGVTASEPFVSILEFAAGAGAFVLECVRVIERTMKERWRRELGLDGWTSPELRRRWQAYVPAHLLPRLHAYEPMLAPLVVTRLRLVEALLRSGYAFTGAERFALVQRDALAAAPERRFTVIVGNPPYASSSSTPPWLMATMGRWKSGLGETKSDLVRDEWKFLRLAEWTAEQVPRAVVGVVLNRDLLVGIAKRGLRASLQATFPLRRIVDLHGDVRGDVVDENVFAITQGVTIALLCRGGGSGHTVCSLRGRRAEKLALLAEPRRLAALARPLAPREPYYRWDMSEETCDAPEYAGWWPLPRIFPVHGAGIQSKNDAVCVGFTAAEVRARVELLAGASAEEATRALGLQVGGAWSLTAAQAELRAQGPDPGRVRRLLYRPFDWRWTYMSERSGGFLGRPRASLMRHMLAGDSLGLVFNRQIVGRTVSHFGVTREPCCHGTFYLGNRGQDFLAPLYTYAADGSRRANVSEAFAAAAQAATGATLTPEAALRYVYAVVHSPTYRARYGGQIRVDFARVPIAAEAELLTELVALGAELAALHLLTRGAKEGLAEWTGPEGQVIEVATWSDGHVFVDRRRSCGFFAVPEAVWRFEVGGYAPCERWLKARRGRTLTAEEVAHYRAVVAALEGTIAVMRRIDERIHRHGGWPGAFASAPAG